MLSIHIEESVWLRAVWLRHARHKKVCGKEGVRSCACVTLCVCVCLHGSVRVCVTAPIAHEFWNHFGTNWLLDFGCSCSAGKGVMDSGMDGMGWQGNDEWHFV
jgi:hypothetical protein